MKTSRSLGILAVLAIPAIALSAFAGCSSSSDAAGDDDSNPVGGHDSSIIDSAPIPGDGGKEAAPPSCVTGLSYVDPEGGTHANPSPQTFAGGMNGCPGRVLYRDRASLCGPTCRVCSASEWVGKRGTDAPQYDYWVDDLLGWSGAFTAPGDVCYAGELDASVDSGAVIGEMCQSDPYPLDGGTLPDGAPVDGGIFDPGPTSMRVCMSTDNSDPYAFFQTDPLGNTCIWLRCAFGDHTVTYPDAGPDAAIPNFDYMGGCENDYTAGTLCCCD